MPAEFVMPVWDNILTLPVVLVMLTNAPGTGNPLLSVTRTFNGTVVSATLNWL